MSIKKVTAFAVFMFVVCGALVRAQTPCSFTVSGTVICLDDGQPLFAATVGFDKTSLGTSTDEHGGFVITNVCNGSYHIKTSMLGYYPFDSLITVNGDTKVTLHVKSKSVHLAEVHVNADRVHKQDVETVTKSEISGLALQQTRGVDLGDALKEITGVSVIHSGPTIAKPVIHGLHSNRVLILNNGVRQEGQQWGSEHAPEIDPFIATKLSVIKGAASIRYGSDAIGGVILVEPAELPKARNLSGELNLVGMDNGMLYAGSGIVQGAFGGKLSGLSMRAQGTYRRGGNLRAPHYNLDNTGLKEDNYSGTIGYNKEHFGATVYYSQFKTDIGIFTGSHVGNPAELLQAFTGEKPIEDYGFSYTIKRGYQSVNHALFKSTAYVKTAGIGTIEATFARQFDVRQEFDFHIPYTSNGVDLSKTPQVNFQLITHTAELIWEHNPWHHITGSVGGSFITQGNVFKGLTYRSIIPNFRNYGGGLFVIEKWIHNQLTVEAGVRYDYKWQREYQLDPTTLLVSSPTQSYRNATSTLGFIYRVSPSLSINANVGNAWRAPSVYELYAYGIHGTLSTFEIGDSTLKSERAYNTTASLRYESKTVEAELGGYVNVINNYIFLQPQPGHYAVTYNGSYPLFYFKQTNALYKGIDLTFRYHVMSRLTFESKSTLVFANDLTHHTYLVLTPQQRFQNSLEYRWLNVGKWSNVFLSVGNLIVPKQTRVPPNSDFVPAPKGYTLFNAAAGVSIPAGCRKINVSVEANNLLNTAYRDYLNLFRYYADEPGRTIQLRIQIPFQLLTTKEHSTNN